MLTTATPTKPRRFVKIPAGWIVGEIVNVGFVRDLEVTGRDAEGTYSLVSTKGQRYEFTPFQGLKAEW